MNKFDALVLAILFAATAYAANLYYPDQVGAFAGNGMVRVFAIVLAVAAGIILLLDYFVKVFSKSARQP